MNSRDTGPILDSDLLLRTRLRRGLSQRQLARTIGLSAPVIARLEAGEGHGALHIWRLAALADALALPLTALFTSPTSQTPPADDDVHIEAALLSSRAHLRSEELAHGLDWTHARTDQALRALRERLAGTGALLYRNGNGWTITAREGILDRASERRLAAAQRARRGFRLDEAALLWQIAYNQLDAATARNPGRRMRQLLAQLLRAGLVERAGGTYHVSAPVHEFLEPRVRRHTPAR